MFKFCFNVDEDTTENDYYRCNNKDESECVWIEAEEIIPQNVLRENSNSCDQANIFLSGDYEVGFIDKNSLSGGLKGSIAEAESSQSDLLRGQYEGGLKIWECTQDLADYLTGTVDDSTTPTQAIDPQGTISTPSVMVEMLRNAKVLDLGCGAGILGILALQCGAAKVHFQDYNKEVIEQFTIPNVRLNAEENELVSLAKCKFYSGDWKSFIELTEGRGRKYDVILTSETIYNVENYGKLIDLFASKLKPSGVVFLAAKTYYFGVGGGLRQFEKTLQEDNRLVSKVVWNSSTGVMREILEIRLKDS